MNKKCIVFLLAVFYSTMSIQASPKSPCLLIIDTQGHPQYYYRNLTLLAQSVGFNPQFLNLYDLLEQDTLPECDALFFLITGAFLKNITTPLGKHCWQQLKKFCQQRNKLIGILFPPLRQPTSPLISYCIELLKECGIYHTLPLQDQLKLNVALISFLQITLRSDSYNGSVYGTTLLNSSTTFKEPLFYTTPLSTLLPHHQECPPPAKKTLPLSMYFLNKGLQNRYFISKSSDFTFSEVDENFYRCPIDFTVRTALLSATQQILWELHYAYVYHASPDKAGKNPHQLPKQLTLSYLKQQKKEAQRLFKKTVGTQKKYAWIMQQGIFASWEAPQDYWLHEDPGIRELTKNNPQEAATLKKQALTNGIQLLYDANTNLLWFEFNPEAYLSPHARYKIEKQEFIEQITTIAQSLKQYCRTNKKPMPHIFIGTDITTNFATHPVKHPAQDLFGTVYSKIPNPLDMEHFWQPEVLDIFDTLITTFNQIMPITGIFFDFEMYHAQDQAGLYSEYMDFSTYSWQIYCKYTQAKEAQECTTHQKRIAYLMKHKAFNDYFNILHQEAFIIGRRIKNHMLGTKPDLLLGAYLPTLPNSWFYRGILAGLSSYKDPLILATFNTDFYSHAQWLNSQKIYALHGIPLLLSKLTDKESFSLLPTLLEYHDFIWLSRLSRMVYKNKENQWWSNEATKLDNKLLVHYLEESLT